MNSFTIYEEYYDLITILPDVKEQGELLVAICDYMFYNKEPNLNTNQMKIFRNLKRPLDVSKKNSKKSKQEPNDIQTETRENPKGYPSDIQTESKQKPNDIQTETHQDVNVYVNGKCNSENNRGVGKEETSAKTEEQILETEFSKLWEKYPNKASESYAKTSYLTARKNGVSYETIAQGLEAYLEHLKTNNVPAQYIKKGNNWFKEGCWNDKYPTSPKKEPEWFKKDIKGVKATDDEQEELEKMMEGIIINDK